MAWWTKSKPTDQSDGFTLVEVIVALGVAVIIITGVSAVMSSGIQLLEKIENRTSALSVANQQMEFISNLNYDAIGTISGVPSGNIPQTQTQYYKDLEFTINTRIQYIDDVFDGVLPTDPINTDYKLVQVTVRWENDGNTERVRLVKRIVPNGLETAASGGTLWIEVFDPSQSPVVPVADATIQIDAPSVSPAVSISAETDADGRFILPGAPEGIEAYAVTITKNGYGTDKTYTRDVALNPNPQPPHLNIINGEVTKQFFQISPLVDYVRVRFQTDDDKITLCHFQNGSGTTVTVSENSVTTHLTEHGDTLGPCVGDYDDTKAPLNIPLRIHGTSIIGTNGNGDSIYEFDQSISTGTDGEHTFNDIESDTYSIEVDEASIGYVITGYSLPLPLVAQPSQNYTVTVDLAPYEPYTALVSVQNSSGLPLTDATITLQPTVGQAKTTPSYQYGQAFFSGLTSSSYTLTVTHAGYTTHAETVVIDGNERIIVTLAAAQ